MSNEMAVMESGSNKGRSESSPVVASTMKNGNNSDGRLSVSVLSIYDLPESQQPLSVSMSILDQISNTDAPLARHKDRNSFKFKSSPLFVTDSLANLYKAKATLTVQYRAESNNMVASLQLDTLKIHETAWLILNLQQNSPQSSPNSPHDTLDVPPTIRLKLRLEGPYRPEVAALISLANTWFSLIDRVESSTHQIVGSLPKLPALNFMLVPTVPIATILVVSSPIIIGIFIVTLPLFLPLVILLATSLIALFSAGLGVYASTKLGRDQVATFISPLYNTVASTPSGQRLLYQTGPRPTPVSLARIILPKSLLPKLFLSLFIDLVGSSSYLLPIVGEGFDLAWAPLQTVLIIAMYDQLSPNLKYVSFVEEILPFTDFIPSATIGWLTEFGPSLIGGDKQTSEKVVSAVHHLAVETKTAGSQAIETETGMRR